MKPPRPTTAVRGSLVVIICLLVTVLAAGWSPADWIRDSPFVRALAPRTSAPRYGPGGSPTPQAPDVTATMTGAIVNDADADGKADPGDRIRYTATIAAAGADATGVHFADTPDANTTLVVGSIVVSPLAANETYSSVGNMTLTSSAIAADCDANPRRSVTCNDTLNGGTLTGFGPAQGTAHATTVTGTNTVTTSAGGTVLLNPDGTFVYNPAAGFEGIDTFWYTLSNAAGTDKASVTITVGNGSGMVWFVSSGGGGTGRQANPFTLAAFHIANNNGAGTNPTDGDTVFLLEGAHTGPVTLRANQKFIGQDATVPVATLDGPAVQPGNAYPAVNPTGTAVTLTSASAGITLALNNSIAGFTVAGSATAAAINGSVPLGSLRVREVIVSTTGQAIGLTGGGTVVNDPTYTGFTSVTSTGGLFGINLSNIAGTLALGTGGLSGATGFTVLIANSTATVTYGGTVNATSGNGLVFTNADGVYNLNGTVTLSGTARINIQSGSSGTFNFAAGSSITSPSTAAFNVSASSPTVDYKGTITQNTASQRAVSIDGTTGGSITFDGAVTSGGTSRGVNINNANGNVAFAGGLTLSTGANPAFTATNPAPNSGTVTVTGSTNTLATTTGTALSLTNTTIGAAGLTFRSISSNGAVNGIVLDNTGTSGGLTVTGNGGTCTFATPTCTGGRIQNTAGADGTTSGIGVRLNSTRRVSLSRMRIDNHSNFAIHGASVVGFTLDSSVIDGTNGTNANFDEGAIGLRELTGTTAAGTPSSITNSFIGGGHEFLIDLRNFNGGTLDRLTVDSNTIGDLDGAGPGFGVSDAAGDDALHFEGFGSNATFNVTASNNILNSGRGDVVNFNIGTGGNTGLTSDFVLRSNTIHNTHPGILSGGGGTTVTMGGGATINSTYDISCNSVRGARGFALLVAKTLGGGTAQGTIFNNRFGVDGAPGSSSTEASGLNVDSGGAGTHTVLIQNNIVNDWGANGAIQLFNNQGSSTLNATVIGNVSNNPHPGNAFAGLYAETGALAGDTNVTNLLVGGGGAAENNFVEGDPFDFTDVLLSRIAGAGTTFNLSRGISAAGNVQQIITDNNVDPVTADSAGTITFVNTIPALPPAIDELCSPPSARLAQQPATYLAEAPVQHDILDSAEQPPGFAFSGLRTAAMRIGARRSALQPRWGDRAVRGQSVTARLARVWISARELLGSLRDAATNGWATTLHASPQPPPVGVDLGTLPAGRTITVVFEVTVNTPPVAQYSNHGTVSGTNFSDEETDTVTTPGDRFDTLTALVSSWNPSSQGQSVTFTATVAPVEGAVRPDGTVQFKDGAANLGGAVTCAAGGSTTCSAQFTTTTLATGTRTITAEYSGGTHHDASTSDTVSQVNRACTATPIVVTTNQDAGAGSLRQAILDACPGNTITFSGVAGPIGLTSGQLTIDKHLTITGPGANLLTVERASGTARIFAVNPGVTATIEDLTIANGQLGGSDCGAGIYNDRGTLTVRHATLSGHFAASGGAICSNADGSAAALTLVDSTLSGNTASFGGAIFTQGITGGTSTVSIVNSTISGNMVAGDGGGLYASGATGASVQATITNSTMTGNRAGNDGGGTGGGIYVVSGTVTLRNTIVARNVAGASPGTAADDVIGALAATSAFNLIGVDTGMTGVTHGTNGNQVGTSGSPIDPRVGALATNGGPTLTHALLAGSPALDAGDNTLAIGGADQRGTGFARIRDASDAGTGQTVDIGSFEADPSIEDITDKTTNEATRLTFTFSVGDGGSAILFDSITATSSNTMLLPDANATVGPDTASTRTLTLTPAANQSGMTTITVMATKTVGGTPVRMVDTFVLTVSSDNGLLITNLSATPPSPVSVGTSTTWTAVATGGTLPLQYKFWLYNEGAATWSIVREYATSNQVSWTPSAAGSYRFQVWVRSAGSTASWKSWLNSAPYAVVAASPPAITSVSPTPASTISVGTPVTWTAVATGGAPPLQYKFWLYNQSAASWSVLREYAGSNQVTWTPAAAGTNTIQVWVRSAGSLAAHEAWRNSDAFVVSPVRTPTRVSVATDGAQDDDDSRAPSVTADGRFVAFESDATNLVPGDTNGVRDIFVRDRQAGVTTRVSVATGGVQGNGDSAQPAMSADGRFVAFNSEATNLVAGDTNGHSDVFVHDRLTGETSRVSVATGGVQAINQVLFWYSDRPAISADGRFVAFNSEATNLVAGDTNGALDTFVHDRLTSATSRVSVATSGAQAVGNFGCHDSGCPAPTVVISADGRFVGFGSAATNLAGSTAAGGVFLHDRQTNATTLVGDGGYLPAISADGRFVAFNAFDATHSPSGATFVYLYDRETGTPTRIVGSDSGCSPALSADGRMVAFATGEACLGAPYFSTPQVLVHERATGTTVLVSGAGGVPGNAPSGRPALSADGRFVAFDSSASNLVSADTNGTLDVFVSDRGESGPATVLLVSADVPSPRPLSTAITWTAYAGGGTSSLEYKFWLYDLTTNAWTVLQDYAVSRSVGWTPVANGTYVVQVWVRSAGSTAGYEAWRNSEPFVVRSPDPVTVAFVTNSVACPGSIGTAVTWTAFATGGMSPLQYKFWLRNETLSTWSVLHEYATTNAVVWTPTTAGTYSVQVWVRSPGSSAGWEAWRNSAPCAVVAAKPPAITSVSPTPPSPVSVGRPVTWTAVATGGAPPVQYKFWLYNQGTASWSVLQEYAESNRVTWTPAAAGTYTVQVWVRSAGSAASWDAWETSQWFVVEAAGEVSWSQLAPVTSGRSNAPMK